VRCSLQNTELAAGGEKGKPTSFLGPPLNHGLRHPLHQANVPVPRFSNHTHVLLKRHTTLAHHSHTLHPPPPPAILVMSIGQRVDREE
jgi:hypothetical protein